MVVNSPGLGSLPKSYGCKREKLIVRSGKMYNGPA